ncbi:MAG: hypothetical protein Q8Q08_03135 [Candidatus Omnitrophota bacterium]|nr:hypothetical protein [Candidatus Omnitrophota bacterium]
MERIGRAASKIAQGNIFVYNFIVVALSFMFSLLLYLVAGSSIILALAIIGYVANGVTTTDISQEWRAIIKVCMASLTAVVVTFNFLAILKNARIKMK